MCMARVRSSSDVPSYPFDQKTRIAASRASASENSRGLPIFRCWLLARFISSQMPILYHSVQKYESLRHYGTSETHGSKVNRKGGFKLCQENYRAKSHS